MTKLDDLHDKLITQGQRNAQIIHGINVSTPNLELVGTCQACFGEFVVHPKTGKLLVVLHGYKRPGDGYIIGECPGRNEEPFEIAKDITEKFLSWNKTALIGLKESLHRAKSGQVTSLHIEIEDRTKPRDRNWRYPTKTIKIDPSYGAVKPDPYWETWAEHLKKHIREIEGRIGSTEMRIRFLERMIASWKYNPQALVGVKERKEAAKKTTRDEQRKVRENKEAAAQAKRDEALETARRRIREYLEQPAFAEWIVTREKTYYKGNDITLMASVTRKLEEAREGRDRIYDYRHILEDLKRAAQNARAHGVKVKNPK
jgi:hypothetical protein